MIIDEISMISSHTLYIVHSLIQHCKSNKLAMGGMQRVFCGDFLQLPPVPNDNSEDIGQEAILSDDFSRFVPHRVFLEEVRET